MEIDEIAGGERLLKAQREKAHFPQRRGSRPSCESRHGGRSEPSPERRGHSADEAQTFVRPLAADGFRQTEAGSRPARGFLTMAVTLRDRSSVMATIYSATDRVLRSGVFFAGIPQATAAAVSMRSRPVPCAVG